ncbi:MFS transporter [Rummeliibacillus suwonensis]|uniref:MFS transporter n=1 Tax=Rummeliibacillus suwonensis TaxID=1306154 RepID=UPI00289DCC82|nr:MFS transporter [Rummeliibacillus suwonensis]
MKSIEKASRQQMIKVLLSTLTGNLGSGILSFIIGLLILKSTDSALSFGISQVIGPVVSLVLLPFTGSIVDKFDKKKVLVAAQLLSIISLCIYGIMIYYYGFEHLIFTYLLLIFLKISDQFLVTSFTASIVNIVIDEHIQKVKSLQQILSSLTLITAPILAAFLYDFVPLLYLVASEIGLEIMTIFIMLSINFHLTSIVMDEESTQEENILILFKQGLDYMIKSKKLFFALIFAMLVNFMFGAVNVGIPFIQINILHFSNNIYGFTEAIFSFGMIVSGIILSVSKNISYPLYSSWCMINVIGLLFVVLGILLGIILEKIYFIIIISIFNLLIGMAITWVNVPITVWMTKEIPKHYQGRVFNILNTGAQLLTPLGILFFSALFDHSNNYSIFMISGFIILLITLTYPLLFKINLKENQI